MKSYVKSIVKLLDDYTERQNRIEYLRNEIKEYNKVIETISALETSDANNEIISKVKEEIFRDETFITIYMDEINELAIKVEDRYDSEVSYSELWSDDVNSMIKTMRENVSSDLLAGYAVCKIKDELDEINNYVVKMENKFRELTSKPNNNVVFFADLVNRGVCGL